MDRSGGFKLSKFLKPGTDSGTHGTHARQWCNGERGTHDYVLLVSERSLLPVLTTARDLDDLVPRFMRQLDKMISALGVRQGLIDRELSQMEPIHFGRTNSRSVLGTMNDFVQMFKYMLPDGQDLSLLDWSLQLAKAPCGPIDMESPNRLTQRLLENPHNFEVIDGDCA